jgi:hypothetical protein
MEKHARTYVFRHNEETDSLAIEVNLNSKPRPASLRYAGRALIAGAGLVTARQDARARPRHPLKKWQRNGIVKLFCLRF